MVNMEYYGRRVCAAILAGERVAFEHLKAHFLADGFSLHRIFLPIGVGGFGPPVRVVETGANYSHRPRLWTDDHTTMCQRFIGQNSPLARFAALRGIAILR